jgi:4'-phosphopantetheinyl transferase EntD
VARSLLTQIGLPGATIPKNPDGAPIWPEGIVGSFAHDDAMAVAAIGRRENFAAIGVDVEAPLELPCDTTDLIVTARERSLLDSDPLAGKALFAAKEATYKAVHPLDRTFLEYHDIEIDLAGGTAMIRNGRKLALKTCTSPYVIALAWLPAKA